MLLDIQQGITLAVYNSHSSFTAEQPIRPPDRDDNPTTVITDNAATYLTFHNINFTPATANINVNPFPEPDDFFPVGTTVTLDELFACFANANGLVLYYNGSDNDVYGLQFPTSTFDRDGVNSSRMSLYLQGNNARLLNFNFETTTLTIEPQMAFSYPGFQNLNEPHADAGLAAVNPANVQSQFTVISTS